MACQAVPARGHIEYSGPLTLPHEINHGADDPLLASAYFTTKLQERLLPWLRAFAFETDNKALGKRALGDDSSYGELEMVRAHLQRD